MKNSSGSVVKRNVAAAGWRSDPESAASVLVRRADDAVSAALARGTESSSEANAPDAGAGTTVRPPFADREQSGAGFSRRIDFPPPPEHRAPKTTLHALQEWEGYVVEVGETDFVARLIDLTAGSENEDEEAIIPLAEISDDDVARMREGSIFRWVIGYERSVTGTKKRVSQIVFRDLPAITAADLRDAEAWAEDTARAFEA